MKIQNKSGTFAYAFKQNGKLVGCLPGAIVEVPKESEPAVRRLVEKYAENPETAVFLAVSDDAKVSPPPNLNESADETAARERIEAKARATDRKRDDAEKAAAQKRQEDARLSTEGKIGDHPPNVIRGADGKPIPSIK